MTTHRARELWIRFEALHAVTYFSPQSAQAAKDAGLKGFWMGYFGFRAAPMGAVSAGVVEATFANFATERVRRAIPDAWSLASPESLILARASGAAAALRDLDPAVLATAQVANPLLERMVGAADGLGRPLFTANRGLELSHDPVERLWQLTTSLREHRGDGHVIALAAEGVSGPQAHLLLIAERGLSEDLFLLARGFDETQWNDAKENLRRRGLTNGRELTDAGVSLRSRIEETTDRLADSPLDAVSTEELDRLLESLDRSARTIHNAGMIPPDNPIGLPILD
ncbi:MAG: SCO6745 family protein [Acidimicrobiales bacterium]